jgi:hypothetical protein
MVMLFLDGAFAIGLFAFWVFCVLDVLTSDSRAVRNLPKVAWVFIVVLVYVFGGVAWLIAGRPQPGAADQPAEKVADRTGPRPAAPWHLPNRPPGAERPARPHQTAPDDDPEFLAGLRHRPTDDEQLLRDWEADLRRREDRLRDEDEPPAG